MFFLYTLPSSTKEKTYTFDIKDLSIYNHILTIQHCHELKINKRKRLMIDEWIHIIYRTLYIILLSHAKKFKIKVIF